MKGLKTRSSRWTLGLALAAVTIASGCNKYKSVDNTAHFADAINTYYGAHPACLWKTSVKFPVQADTSDASKTAPYDALVDQGLLARDQKGVHAPPLNGPHGCKRIPYEECADPIAR